MKPRTVLILALLVAVLGALIWLVERDLPSSEERAELAKRLLRVEAGEVTGLSVEWGEQAIALERRTAGGAGDEPESDRRVDDDGADAGGASEWRIVEPLEARADAAEVDRLLRTLTELESERTIDDADPGSVGLDVPRGTVTIRTEDGGWILSVGAEVPTSDDVLVALDREGGSGRPEAEAESEPGSERGTVRAHVTSGAFVDRLRREPGAWRDRDVFPGTRNAVERLTLRAPRATGSADPGEGEQTVVLAERDGDGFWIEEPISDRADVDLVDDLLSELVGLRVERFVDESTSEGGSEQDPGLDPPRAEIEAGLAGGDSFRLELGAAAADGAAGPDADRAEGSEARALYARADGQLFTVETDLLAMVTRPAAKWRSPAWTALRSFQVEEVELIESAEGVEPFTLRRADGGWERNGESVPYTVASDLLSAIAEAEGGVVPEEGLPRDLDEPLLILRLTPREGEPVTLALHPESEGRHLARSSERSAVIGLSAETGSEVLEAVTAVLEAETDAEDEDGETEGGDAAVSRSPVPTSESPPELSAH